MDAWNIRKEFGSFGDATEPLNSPTSSLLVMQDNKSSYCLNHVPLGLSMLAAWGSLKDRASHIYLSPLHSLLLPKANSHFEVQIKHPSLPAS